MTRAFVYLLLTSIFWLLGSIGATHAQIRIIDDRGVAVALKQPATRIVSLSPHLTENLFAIGAGERLVGVTTYSDFPPAARDIEVIGSNLDFDIERIVELKPDIVLGWISGNPAEAISRIKRFGIPVYLTEPRHAEDVASEIRRLGVITGRSGDANLVAEQFISKILSLRARYSQRETVTVFYEVWNAPLITLNGEHLISRLLADCGAHNIFGELGPLAPKVGIEAVLARDPEAILAGGTEANRLQWQDGWARYPFLRAVRYDNLFHIHPDFLQRHTTRLAHGMRLLCEAIELARQRKESVDKLRMQERREWPR